MGQQQSKGELLYQQVNYGNVEGIKALRGEGAGLEWIDREGKTPLIAASMNPQLYNVAKTLVELGANVNAYRPGRHAGTPLHHASKRGLDQMVTLLLAHGANPLVMNDDCQTPLDVARAKGYNNVVRTIEGHVCLFSGWLRELYGPGFLDLLAPQLLSRKVWVVILPCGSRNLWKPLKLELALYAGAQDAQPRTIVPLWKSNLGEPNFNQPNPASLDAGGEGKPLSPHKRQGISTQIKLAPVSETEKQHLQRFCNACKGIPQVIHPSFPLNNPVQTAPANAPAATECHKSNLSKCELQEAGPSVNPAQHLPTGNTIPLPSDTIENSSALPIPSAPPIRDLPIDDGPVHYPSIDTSPIDLSSPSYMCLLIKYSKLVFLHRVWSGKQPIEGSGTNGKQEDGYSSSCTICLDAPAATEDEDLAMALNASVLSSPYERAPQSDASTSFASSANSSTRDEKQPSMAPTSHKSNLSKCELQEAGPSVNPAQHLPTGNTIPLPSDTIENSSALPIPSAPPIRDLPIDDGPVHYPSIDTSPIDLSSPSYMSLLIKYCKLVFLHRVWSGKQPIEGSGTNGKQEDGYSSSCTICLDAPLEGACIPCGHMAGCMSCLNEIKEKRWGCPVCRAKIDQVIRIYVAV